MCTCFLLPIVGSVFTKGAMTDRLNMYSLHLYWLVKHCLPINSSINFFILKLFVFHTPTQLVTKSVLQCKPINTGLPPTCMPW